MQKASKIILLVVALLAISAAHHNAEAQGLTNIDLQKVNLSSSTFVSTAKKPTSKTKAKPTKKLSLPAISQVYASDTFQPPTPTVNVATTPTTTPEPTPPSANLDANKIFDMVNAYRASNGLAAFEKANDEIQKLAQVRSVELIGEGANGSIHAGLYNRNLPYWIWENAKYGSDEAGTVAWWENSWLHRHSILGDYKYSAVACTGNYCVQLFTSLVPK